MRAWRWYRDEEVQRPNKPLQQTKLRFAARADSYAAPAAAPATMGLKPREGDVTAVFLLA